MSLESWKAEFYPLGAKDVTKEEALDHSIRKWEGLSKENLHKHNMEFWFRDIREKEGQGCLEINDSTCALCVHHRDDEMNFPCKECPLAQARSNVPCDKIGIREYQSPYRAWSQNQDPKPMLEWLHRAKKMAEEKANANK